MMLTRYLIWNYEFSLGWRFCRFSNFNNVLIEKLVLDLWKCLFWSLIKIQLFALSLSISFRLIYRIFSFFTLKYFYLLRLRWTKTSLIFLILIGIKSLFVGIWFCRFQRIIVMFFCFHLKVII